MPRKSQQHDSEPLSFEQLYTELEATIEKLEAGNLSLDDALALYERGMELAKQCGVLLDRADLRIQELAPSVAVFDADDDEADLFDADEDE